MSPWSSKEGYLNLSEEQEAWRRKKSSAAAAKILRGEETVVILGEMTTNIDDSCSYISSYISSYSQIPLQTPRMARFFQIVNLVGGDWNMTFIFPYYLGIIIPFDSYFSVG